MSLEQVVSAYRGEAAVAATENSATAGTVGTAAQPDSTEESQNILHPPDRSSEQSLAAALYAVQGRCQSSREPTPRVWSAVPCYQPENTDREHYTGYVAAAAAAAAVAVAVAVVMSCQAGCLR